MKRYSLKPTIQQTKQNLKHTLYPLSPAALENCIICYGIKNNCETFLDQTFQVLAVESMPRVKSERNFRLF